MARFTVNVPISTTEPLIEVDGVLPAGLHHFRLEVVGATGRVSPPAEVVVHVQGATVRPVALAGGDPPPGGPTPIVGPPPDPGSER